MGLKQFSTISQLLENLKEDLSRSNVMFLRQFIDQRSDGLNLLMDILKVIQLSQANITTGLDQSVSKAIFTKALEDEHQTLLCVKLCLQTNMGMQSIASHPSSLFTISVCLMSNYNRSRVLALQILETMCYLSLGNSLLS